uniref:protein SET n=1 Tax=Ciona intestinalis TaxID=7719 RepID=UPI0000524639|nr:protein SET [Ciona intestinalis]|eukprot:XP_018670608.1 protein SET [Ciona intestinalis]
MSESPDLEEKVETKVSRVRPSGDNEDVVPRKIRKEGEEWSEEEVVTLDDDDSDNEDNDEADFDLIDDEEESSGELDELAQSNLGYIEGCQTDIDLLNQKANDEILQVEQKYIKLRQPVYTRRSRYIERVPHFWATVFSRHPQLKRVLTKEDIQCLKYLTNIQICDFEDSRSGYHMIFHFAGNPWFDNSTITKEYHLPWHDAPSCECSDIKWKQGMNLTKKSSSFFSWFCSQEDASTDDIAEIIKEELWPNPLQSFLLKENEESASEESDVDSNGEPVYITDDGAEYISSDDATYARGVQGKVAPGGSKEEPYVIEDGDGDGEFEDESKLDEELLLDDVIDEADDVIDEADDVIDEADDVIDEPDDVIDEADDVIDEGIDDIISNSETNDVIHKNNDINNGNIVTSSNNEQLVTSSNDDIINQKHQQLTDPVSSTVDNET